MTDVPLLKFYKQNCKCNTKTRLIKRAPRKQLASGPPRVFIQLWSDSLDKVKKKAVAIFSIMLVAVKLFH